MRSSSNVPKLKDMSDNALKDRILDLERKGEELMKVGKTGEVADLNKKIFAINKILLLNEKNRKSAVKRKRLIKRQMEL